MILVGTNGFQYRDWVPIFYPRNLDPCCWLKHYSHCFGCCELNFTHYRIPESITIKQLISGSDGALQFVLRVPFRLLEEHPGNAELARGLAAALWPLKEAGQLAGLIAQYPPEFGFIHDNFRRLCSLRDSLDGMLLIAEFGNADWLTPRAAKHLAAERIALACVDGSPSLKDRTFFCATASLAYVRFQGRNQSRWIKGDGSSQHNYLYSKVELEAVVPEIRRLESESERVLVVLNNPWRGQAALNARTLLDLLSVDSGQLAVRSSQFTVRSSQ
jgi:uncharacterized protein YecE (DUF72 family)